MTTQTRPAWFERIVFDSVSHTYTLDGALLHNVSSLVRRVKEPYDAPAHAARLAPIRGTTAEALLAEWDAARDASTLRGHLTHQYIAAVLGGAEVPFDRLPEMLAFDRWWKANRDDLVVLDVEMIVGDAELGVAGTLDLLVYSRLTQALHVVDFKTNKRFDTESRFRKFLLHPFSDLGDCHLVEYSLQVNIYRFILARALATASLQLPDTVPEHRRNTTLGDCRLVHLSREGTFRDLVALDLQQRLEGWLLPDMAALTPEPPSAEMEMSGMKEGVE